MVRYVTKRILSLIPLLLAITFLDFMILHLLPGDVIDIMYSMQGNVSEEQLAQVRSELGMDQPVAVQYVQWLGRALRGDFGVSPRSGRAVVDDLASRIPVTVELAIGALIVGTLLGLTAGVIAAVYRNTLFDSLARVFSLIGLSMPSFWLGTLLILATALWFPRLFSLGYSAPAEGLGRNLRSLLLPSLSLGIPMSAIVARIVRSSLLEVMSQDYVRTARAKGLGERAIMLAHIARNAAIPVITVIGLQMGGLLGGAIIIEQIFIYPGLGQMTVQSIMQRDYFQLQGVVLVVAVMVVLVNLFTDLIYGLLDPTIRYE